MNILDILFPKKCVGCGRVGGYICSECVGKFRVQENQVCPSCGRGSMFGRVHSRCERKWGVDGVVSVFEYRGVVKRMVGKLKYRLVKDLVSDLVEVMVSIGDFEVFSRGKWVVVGVPLHDKRLRQRGFNQSEELGRRLAEYFGWEYWEGVLVREKYTVPQVELSGKERVENVKGAFGLSGSAQCSMIKGRRMVLVDDVWTTGSTMRECGKVLKRAGVREVWGLVIAS